MRNQLCFLACVCFILAASGSFCGRWWHSALQASIMADSQRSPEGNLAHTQWARSRRGTQLHSKRQPRRPSQPDRRPLGERCIQKRVVVAVCGQLSCQVDVAQTLPAISGSPVARFGRSPVAHGRRRAIISCACVQQLWLQ